MNPATRFFEILTDDVLPYWSTEGVDPDGGFFEQVLPDGTKVGTIRRARVVNRQIYAFTTAHELGWAGPAVELVNHGVKALRSYHLDGSEVIPQYRLSQHQPIRAFDLYDQAFALFGLAHATKLSAAEGLEDQALAILGSMRSKWAHTEAGFYSRDGQDANLEANPHMHLLEAALAWSEVSQCADWQNLGEEIASLCLRRFINPATGALSEFFDRDWRPLDDAKCDVIEPGHQAEWAWLLNRWADRSGNSAVISVATRLFEIAETYGLISGEAKLVNSLDSSLAVTDPLFRLWPQTERVKALVQSARCSNSATERNELDMKIDAASLALLDYFDHPVAGAWWEHLEARGKPAIEPTRSSSLYHIMGAAKELGEYRGLRLR